MQHSVINNSVNTFSSSVKKVLSFLLLTLTVMLSFLPNGAKAQNSANYAFATATNGSLALDRIGNAIDTSVSMNTLLTGTSDAGVSSVTNIGFTYTFMGNSYTQFSASADGLLGLGGTAVSGTVASGGTTTTPQISACGGDFYLGVGGKIRYKVVGSAPSRCLVVEWTNMAITYGTTAANANSNWQVRLYETGALEFVYGKMNCTVTTYGPLYAGFSVGTSINKLASITYATNTVSTAATFNTNAALLGDIANLNSAANGSRRIYTFFPPQPCVSPTAQPTGLSVAATAGTFDQITGTFTASSPASNSYLVLATTENTDPSPVDGTNYVVGSSFGPLSALVVSNSPSTSFTATGLSQGRTYYFWVYSSSATNCSTTPVNDYLTTPSALTGTATTNVKVLPTCATTVTPANNYNGFSPVDTLRWSAVTAVPAVTKYLLYFSKTQSLVETKSSTVRTDLGNVLKYQPGTLDYSSTYYWSVLAVVGTDTAIGCVNSFTTAGPAVPLCYTGTITPSNGATGISPAAAITWGASLGAPSPTGYDIYMSTSYSAVQGLQLSSKIISNTPLVTFTPSFSTILLSPSTTYYWVVVPTNYVGGASGCSVYSFTTYTPSKVTSTTKGGVWSDANTWVGGVVPLTNDSVVIADGATVYASATPNLIRNLIIGQDSSGNAILQVAAALNV